MYVQWLLEFVWRIFIQGPLMLINFFTSGGAINKLSSTIGFINKNDDWEGLNSFINIGITSLLFLIIFLFVFIFKLFKVIINSSHNETKIQIIEYIKEFGKLIAISLFTVVAFQAVFLIFDVLARAIDKGYNSVENKFNGTISSIPDLLYSLITNGKQPPKDNSFLFPDQNFLMISNKMNFFISILFIISFAGFMIWIIWSIYQKMIEIFFLYLSFPISLAFSLESERINWKIWSKEIINKIVLVFVLMLFLRLYLYMFYFIYTGIIAVGTKWNTEMDKLYLSFFLILALGSSMIFITKFISIKSKEKIGIFTSINSFRQTQNFINKNQIKKPIKFEAISLGPINENVSQLKREITKFNHNINYSNLRKVKVFVK